ncbi:vacuolar protein sorting-associated protein 26B-like [Schistocerca serialis cubense]|uniref:vacuolar protein sorting-associated protein 26B-like n=1 Tax=Schistocerca serialis cubense TaxID=2023355 RepID=UPI00214E461E|nr:vacuolar protein sorting-associated protein 26B-like [Schistocerca serialis cubense]
MRTLCTRRVSARAERTVNALGRRRRLCCVGVLSRTAPRFCRSLRIGASAQSDARHRPRRSCALSCFLVAPPRVHAASPPHADVAAAAPSSRRPALRRTASPPTPSPSPLPPPIHDVDSFFGFGQSAEIDIVLDGTENRKMADIKSEDGKKERHYLFYDGETVSGKVNVTLKKYGSKLEHQGIKIEFIGQIELYYVRGNHHEFTSLVKELACPGELMQNMSYAFEFLNVEKPLESYTGSNVRLRYFLRVTIVRRLSDIIKEMDIVVHTLSCYPEMNNSIKMEVGIEDCLHIEFEYNKSKYHLKDVIVGKIYFLLVRIKIKHMEIAIIKRETTGSGPNTFTENETIAKYEIMDGAPVRGESIPIRVFLAGYDLTPTMRDINKNFSVRYYLNLVLMDEEDRHYFKQQEIT